MAAEAVVSAVAASAQSTAPQLAPLRSLSPAVLAPQDGLRPFADLSITAVDQASSGYFRYWIFYDREGGPGDTVQIRGFRGSGRYDRGPEEIGGCGPRLA